MADALGESFEIDESGITAEDQACIGEKTVTAIGAGRLADLGVTADNASDFDPAELPEMTGDERDNMLGALEGCLDLRRTLADSFGEGDSEVSDCTYEALSDQDARDLLRASMDTDTEESFETFGNILERITGCFE